MKVSELIEELQKLPPDFTVVLTDSEIGPRPCSKKFTIGRYREVARDGLIMRYFDLNEPHNAVQLDLDD